jgi:hypothetical protein
MKPKRSVKLRAKLKVIRELARKELLLSKLQKIRRKLEQKGKSRYVVYVSKRNLETDMYELCATKFTFSSDSRHACEKLRPRNNSHLYCMKARKVF